MACANAISITSRGKAVRSPAQSRNELRSPWTVSLGRNLFNNFSSESAARGFATREPGNTNPEPSRGKPLQNLHYAIASGTRCSLLPFMRWAGMDQTRPLGRFRPSGLQASDVRAAVRTVNSSALAEIGFDAAELAHEFRKLRKRHGLVVIARHATTIR